MSNAFDIYIAYKFIQILTTPWDETDAYELGIVDENGNVLKKSKELKTSEEKKAYTIFHRLIFNLKRLLNKFPLGKSKMASFSAALFLIKERFGGSDQFEREFWHLLKEEYPNLTTAKNLHEQLLGEDVMRPGKYRLKHDVINDSGKTVKAGTEFRVSKKTKSTDVILGNAVFTMKIDGKTVPVSLEDIERV